MTTTTKALEVLTEILDGMAAKHEAITARFGEQVAKYGMAYAIEWAGDDLVHLEVARRWAVVQRRAEAHGLAEAIGYMVDETTEALLDNQLSSSSTSQLTNASNAAKREGASRWLRDAKGMAKTVAAAQPSEEG
jgi:hypothetical protein